MNDGSGLANKHLDGFIVRHERHRHRFGWAVIVGRQVLDLLYVEYRVALEIRDRTVVIGVLILGGKGAEFDDKRSTFALPDLTAEILRLTIGDPGGLFVAVHLRRDPEHENIDAAIGFAAGSAGDDGARAGISMPRANPRLGAGFQLLDDEVGNALIGVDDVVHGRLHSLVDGKKRR